MFFAVLPLSAHPLAKLFPKYGEAELLDVGATSPPMAYQGQILDGVNRHQVCLAAEVIIARVTRT
jgi:hypothetical protein